jgi:transposase-like protein
MRRGRPIARLMLTQEEQVTRYQIVKEALSQKEPMGQIARRHQVSEALIYW